MAIEHWIYQSCCQSLDYENEGGDCTQAPSFQLDWIGNDIQKELQSAKMQFEKRKNFVQKNVIIPFR